MDAVLRAPPREPRGALVVFLLPRVRNVRFLWYVLSPEHGARPPRFPIRCRIVVAFAELEVHVYHVAFFPLHCFFFLGMCPVRLDQDGWDRA